MMNTKEITANSIYRHFNHYLRPKIEEEYGVKLKIEIAASLRHKIIIGNVDNSNKEPKLKAKIIRNIILSILKDYQIFPSLRLYEKKDDSKDGTITLTMEDCQIFPIDYLDKKKLTEPSEEIKTLFDQLITDYGVKIKERKEFNDYVFIYNNEFVTMTVSKENKDFIINHIKKSFGFYVL